MSGSEEWPTPEAPKAAEGGLARHRAGVGSSNGLVAWIVFVFVVLLVAVGFSAVPGGDPLAVLAGVVALVAAVTLALTGAVLMTRLPANRIGWLLSTGGVLFSIAYSGSTLASGLLDRGIGLAVWVEWVAQLCWVPAVVCLAVLVPLLFPTGHLPSRRWRVLVVVALGSIALSTIQSAFSPTPAGAAPPGLANPLGVAGSADLLGLLGGISSLAGVICLPLVAASLVGRYRDAAGIERAQLRWFAAVVAIIGPAFAIGIATGQATDQPAATIGNVAFLIAFIGFALLPVAIGIAVLRYRLYDIDLIVRGTAIYVPLTAILAGMYAGSIALLQRIFVAATGGPSDGAVILSTLILATTFTPIRNWVQGNVDRRFGNAGDAEHILEKFVIDNATGAWALDPVRTMRAFTAVCVRAFGATGGIAFVGEEERAAGRVGSANAAVLSIPVETAGRHVGRVELAIRSGGRPYGERDVALLQRMAADLATLLEPMPNP